MALSDTQRQQISQKLKLPICQVCGSRQWVIHDALIELRPYEGGNFTIGGPVVPAVMAACTNCKQMLLFSAVELGVVSGEGQ